MENDRELIHRLEAELNRKLPELRLEQWKDENERLTENLGTGYVLDEKGGVTTLFLQKIQVESLPPILAEFPYLRALSLYGAYIGDYSLLRSMVRLSALELSYNDNLKDFSFLGELQKLTYLGLKKNGLTDVMPLRGLKKLSQLDLSQNEITDVSPITGLSDLKIVDLADNKLDEPSFIDSFSKLKKLVYLNLRHNSLKQLPESALNLKLDIDINRMGSRSGGIGQKAAGIYLYGNPIETPPVEIVRRGYGAVNAYYDSYKKGNTIPLNEIKVIFIGDGGSGKTSMVKQLLGEVFNEHEPMTHGIAIKHLRIDRENDTVKLNLWDFGGQEIMHATHQFFLSQRSLYVLVLDARKDPGTDYWLKHVRSFGGNSPVLVALNKIDQSPGFEVNRKYLREKFPMIKGFYRLSCKTGEGIPGLINDLNQSLKDIEILNTRWPASWFNVKDQIEGMRQNFLTFQDYIDTCLREGVTEPTNWETLLDFFHDLGIVLSFKDFQLEGTHVLNPRWITEAVYKIINSPIVAEARGIVDLKRLAAILDSEKDYPRDKHRYIIALMTKFELCFPFNSQCVLVPDLLGIQEKSFDFDYEGALSFIFQYDFLPRSVIPRLMVRLHQDIKGDLLWRSGAAFENSAFRAMAIVKADNFDKKLCVYVSGEQRRDYFSVIRHTIRDINMGFEKLETKELVPLPGEPSKAVSYNHLLRIEQEGQEYYFPGDSEKRYRVSDLLGTIEKRKPEGDETLRMLDLIKMSQAHKSPTSKEK